MSQTEIKRNCIYLLGVSLKALACVFTATDVIQNLIHRDFTQLSQSEAYEILRYLLVACGVHLDKNHTFLKYINHPSSSISPVIKADVEKFKMDILQKLKDTFLKSKKELYLRKSDLIDPNNTKFLKCAIQLANAALNHQLEKSGLNFPTDEKLSKVDKNEFLTLYTDLERQGLEIKKESEYMKEIISRHQAVIECMKKDMSILESAKIDARNQIEKIMKHCPDEIKEKPTNHHERLASWSKIVDELHANNMVKLSRLKNIDKNLDDLLSFIDGDNKVNSIEMNTSSFLSPTTMQFCEENNITALDNNRISLFAILKILVLSIPPSSLLQETSFAKLLELKAITNNSNVLYEKYRNTYDELKRVLQKSALNLERKADSNLVNNWMSTYFVPIPEIHFLKKTSEINLVTSTPYIDYEVLQKVQNGMDY